MFGEGASSCGKAGLLEQLRTALGVRHHSRRTEQSYVRWVKRFIFFQGVRHPAGTAEKEINAFLTHLSRQNKVSAPTQNRALSALRFLYRHVIGRNVGDLGEVARARRLSRLPAVMTRDEVKAVLANLSGDRWLMASLMYGAGLRVMECPRLRVQDVDFSRRESLVRDAKGAKDRVTMLPEALAVALKEHLQRVKAVHERDLSEGWGCVLLPGALARKYPNAPRDWRWQWVFPQERRWKNVLTGKQGSHCIDESLIEGGTGGRLEGGPDETRNVPYIPAFLPAFLRHAPPGSAMRHPNAPGATGPRGCHYHHDLTHVLNRGPSGVRSPMDSLSAGGY